MTATKEKILTFDEEKHEYKEDGVIIPSVTQILKEAGLIDLSFVSAELLAEKADIGNKAHKTIELYDIGDLDIESLHPVLKGFLDSWINFKEAYHFIPVLIEKKFVHPLYKYAGRIDRIGMIGILKKDLAQIDIKSGVHHHSYAIQSAGYTELYNYGKPKKEQIKRRLTVYLRENGKYEVKEHTNANDIRVFLSALTITIYKRRKK